MFTGKCKDSSGLEQDLAAARAEIDRLNNALTEAANQIGDLATRLGQAEGRLDASELVGVVEGWKARAETAEAERDEARAQVAAAYKAAEQALEARKYGDPDEREEYAFDAALDRGIVAIRALASDHAQSAFEAYGREKMREGMMRAADIALCHSDNRPRRYSMNWNDGYIDGCRGASDAILAEMGKLK